MKKGDIVRFKEVKEEGDELTRMILIEEPDGGRVRVQSLLEDWLIQPTHIYRVEELEICE